MPPSIETNRETTPLAEKLAARIRACGPISFHDYMEACLYDADFGYYRNKDPLGRGGDFITAPEISQVFGELIGLWAGESWRSMREPKQIRLIELGPGRGTLMADALRALKVLPKFLESATVHLVETSEPLRAAQTAALAGAACPVAWHGALSEVPAGASIAIANEFLDCLPVRQFVFDEPARCWRERMVTWRDGEFELAPGDERFQIPPHPNPLPEARGGACDFSNEGIGSSSFPSPLGEKDKMRGDSAAIEDGNIFEVRPAVPATLETFASRAANAPFIALIVDYGHAKPSFGDTVQAVRNHRFAGIFDAPGETDLTAHVNFSDLVQEASALGLEASGPMQMGEWLLRLGAEERVAQLVSRATDVQAREIRSRVARLVDPAQMGALFKVIVLTAGGLGPLPPF